MKKLLFVAFVLTLAVTALRYWGELQGWSPRLFAVDAGGGLALVGIAWLVPLFGLLFGRQLAADGRLPGARSRLLLAVVAPGLAAGAAYGTLRLLGATELADVAEYPAVILGAVLFGAIVSGIGWGKLAGWLLGYGLLARLPVIAATYLSFREGHRTHYAAVPPGSEATGDPVVDTVLFGAVPQLLFWIPFTILVGGFFGALAGMVSRRR